MTMTRTVTGPQTSTTFPRTRNHTVTRVLLTYSTKGPKEVLNSKMFEGDVLKRGLFVCQVCWRPLCRLTWLGPWDAHSREATRACRWDSHRASTIEYLDVPWYTKDMLIFCHIFFPWTTVIFGCPKFNGLEGLDATSKSVFRAAEVCLFWEALIDVLVFVLLFSYCTICFLCHGLPDYDSLMPNLLQC